MSVKEEASFKELVRNIVFYTILFIIGFGIYQVVEFCKALFF